MKEWPVKRLYKDSTSFRWGARFFLAGLIIASLFFVIQQVQYNGDNDFLEEQFLETQRICSENNICVKQEENKIVFVDIDSLEGSCPHVHLEREANTAFSRGTLSLWTKLESLENNEDRTVFDMIDYEDKSFIKIDITDNRIIKYKIQDKNGQEFILNYNNVLPLTNWTFIVITWDDEKLNLFVNDKLKQSVKVNNVDFDMKIKDWYFGSNHNKRHCLNGLLDEVGLFSIPADKYDVINMYENYNKKCSPVDDCYKEVNLWFKLRVFLSELF